MSQGQRIGYIRVSTTDQNTARQLDGMQLDQTFTDKVSGKSQDRPQLQAMLKHARAGDEVFVHSMDRLARNLGDLLQIVKGLTDRKVRVTFVKEGQTFTGDDSGTSRLMLGILGSVAEFERSMIRERQKEGIAIARAEKRYKGRKAALTAQQVSEVTARAAKGEPKTELAKEFKVSRETIYKALR